MQGHKLKKIASIRSCYHAVHHIHSILSYQLQTNLCQLERALDFHLYQRACPHDRKAFIHIHGCHSATLAHRVTRWLANVIDEP